MALTKKVLIGELRHGINNPLAAIRNALYLAATRTEDPEVENYLKLADAEVTRIAEILKSANQIDENKRVYDLLPRAGLITAA